jgi:hypothetical protein
VETPTPTPAVETPTPISLTPPAATEPPIVDPIADPAPAGNEPPAPTPIADEIRLQAINETLGTTFTSLDEVQSVRTSLGELPSLRETQTKFEELKGTSIAKFHSKALEEANTFAMQTGIDDISFIKEIKRFDAAETKDPIEALVLAEILKDPSLIEQKDLLKKSIQREYKLSVDPDLEGEELEIAQENASMEKFRLSRKAAEASKEINSIMDKVKNAGPILTVNETLKQREALKAQWENTVEVNADKIFTKVPITVPKGKDGNGNDIFETIDTIELSPEDAKIQAKLVVEAVVGSGLELTQENLIKAVSDRYAAIQAKNMATVLSKVRAKAESTARLEWEKKASNPSQIKVETPANPKTEKTPSQLIEEKFNNWMNGQG